MSNNSESPSLKYKDDIALVWIDLSFSGSRLIGQSSRLILNNISGFVKFGSLTALMGPSGSGKSTFLKCINGQNSAGLSPETEFYVNKMKKIRPCFIVQDVSDHLLSGLTARQALLYASKLKNSGENFRVDHKSNIKKLMEELRISDTANTRISRCSGGEQKRIAIAAELTAIKVPNLLCIDEPTSGLDSNAAEILIQCLKRVAVKHHIAIVTSIHQPNSDILVMYDQVYVMAAGGKCVFSGSPHDIGQHLKQSSVRRNSQQVPIEVLIKSSSKGLKDKNVRELINRNYDCNKQNILRYQSECVLVNGIDRPKQSFKLINFWYLLIRTLINTVKQQWYSMILQIVFIPGMMFTVALMGNTNIGQMDGCVNIGQNGSADEVCLRRSEQLKNEALINLNLGFIFLLVILIDFIELVQTVLSFSTEIKIFLNEHTNGWYSTSSYYWAKSLVELPIPVIVTGLYVYLGYTASHQIDETFRVLGTAWFTITGVLCCQGIGFLMCMVFHRNDMAIVMAILLFIINAFLCDAIIPIDEMHPWLQIASDASFEKQVYHSSIIFVYGFDRCAADGSMSWALQQYGLQVDESYKLIINSVIICIHLLVMRLIALFVLIVKAKPEKRAVTVNEVDSKNFELNDA